MNLRQYIKESLQRIINEEVENKLVRGVEILTVPPFNSLPEDRKGVNWQNRGEAYLPSIDGDSKTHILSKTDIIGGAPWEHPKTKKVFQDVGYIEEFIKKYHEEPIFSINSLTNEVSIVNEPFKKQSSSHNDALNQFGTEGD